MTKTIRTQIDITAPIEKVWAVLTSFDEYPYWNPFVTRVVGRLAEGEKLTIEVTLPQRVPMTLKPTVVVVDPPHQFRWAGGIISSSLFRGEHYFGCEAIEGATRFQHGETFDGLLVPVVLRGSLWQASQAAYTAMNRALKARVEAL